MINLSTLTLAAMAAYGAWALGAATLIGAIGLPLPTSMLLLAAGAFMRQGTLDWPTGLALAALGAIMGDCASYLLGRYGGSVLLGRAAQAKTWQQAQATFVRWGWLSVFFSRFLLTPLALPVNLIAGSTHYAAWRFLGAMVLGELVWVLAFSGLGYIFADQWQAVSAAAGSVSLVVVGGAAALIGAAYVARKLWVGQHKLAVA
jgi:membrane protein DedA with SNARE-associated domain